MHAEYPVADTWNDGRQRQVRWLLVRPRRVKHLACRVVGTDIVDGDIGVRRGDRPLPNNEVFRLNRCWCRRRTLGDGWCSCEGIGTSSTGRQSKWQDTKDKK